MYQNSSIKTIVKNLSFLFMGQGTSGIIIFIAMAYLGRILGPHDFGVIGFAEGIFIFFLGLTSLGLDFIGIREVAKARERTKYFTDIIISMRLLLALASFIFLLIFILILEKPTITRYVTVIYGLSLFPAACLLEWVFQGVEKMHFVAMSSIIRAAVFASGIFFLIQGQENLIAISIIYFLSWMIPSLVLLFFYAKTLGLPRLNSDFPAYKIFLKDSLPIGFSLFVGWVIFYFDSTLLFMWKGEKETGIFNASFRLTVLMFTGLTLYFNAIFPTISKSAQGNMDTLKKIINTSIGWILVILLPVAIIGNYLAGSILKLVYGEQFAVGSVIFGILIWWPILDGVTTAYIRTIIACNKQRHIMLGALISAVLNIALSLILIPLWGGYGAAIAKLTTYLVAFAFYFIIIKSMIDIPLFKISLCPIVAAVGMVVSLNQPSTRNIWFDISTAVIVYIAVLFIMSRIMPDWIKSIVGENKTIYTN